MSASLKNIKLTVAYDGTCFLGWQETKTGPSIEEALKEVLFQILQEKPLLQAASRTDRGVHATSQVVNFYTPKTIKDLKKALNALLPPTVAILEVEEMALSFHPTLDCIGKEYTYSIYNDDVMLPQKRLNFCHIAKALDISAMRQGAIHLIGKHDFSSFCNARKNLCYPDKIREIFNIEINKNGFEITIKMAGNHFLYKMARNMAGILVYVGLGKILPSEIPKILQLKSRPSAAVTMPANGLALTKIFYPEKL